jgi:P4 family phage/plasmid primase-like protien
MASDMPEDPGLEDWQAGIIGAHKQKRSPKQQRKVEPMSGMKLDLGSHVELGNRLLGILGGNDRVVYDVGSIHVYNEATGLWVPSTEHETERILHTFDGSDVGGKPIKLRNSDVNGSRKRAEAAAAVSNFFEDAAHGISFKGEFIKLEGGIVLREPHNKEHRCRAGLDCEYTPGAPHPMLDEFWRVVFGDCEEDELSARVALIQEFMGACMFGIATQYQQCLCLLGKGDNGKSEVLRIFESVFPPSALASLPPQNWGMRFQIRWLIGKLVNVCHEIPEQDIIAGDTFKSVITGNIQSAEIKHGDTFTFRPRAGHVFSSNAMPATRDQSRGFFRRWLVLMLTRNVRELDTHRVDAAAEVIENERPAIAAWAIEGAARLQRTGKYTVPTSSLRALDDWKLSVNSVILFANESCTQSDPTRTVDFTNGTQSTELYKAYRTWCQMYGNSPVTRRNFRARLEDGGVTPTEQSNGTYYPMILNGVR